ncbi:MAG: hypothetical protein C5B54_06245 [Acidobacteria bacterium]|nr:MAG: hypothetical protein C5B54_06245 [Acidobacteriota bacterium]
MTLKATAHSSKKSSHVRWFVLAVICIASSILYILKTNLSIASKTLMSDLGITEIQLGFAFSATSWGYALFQFPGGIFGDKVGSRRALTIAATLWGVFTLLTGLIPGPGIISIQLMLTILIALRFLLGASQAPFFPIVGGTIGNWFPISGWALPNGLSSSALTLGTAATGPLMVWLLQASGWRESFFIIAPLGLIAALLWWLIVRDYPVENPAVSESELKLIDSDRPPPIDPSEQKGSWKLVIKDRNILLLTVSYFCMCYIFYLLYDWLFLYLVEVRHFTQQTAGYLTALEWIVGAISATIGGYVCDRCAKKYGPRSGYRIVPVPALILTGVLLIGGAMVNNPYAAVLLLALCCAFTQMSDCVYWGATASIAGRHTTEASGVLNTGGNAVGGIAALMVPITAKYFGWVAAISTGSFFVIAAGLLWFLIKSDQPMAMEPLKIPGTLQNSH